MSQSPRILLAHSYYLTYDAKQTRKMKPYPPLATLLAAAVLRACGVDVFLFDAMLATGENEFERTLREVRPTVVGLLEDNFNFLTKMCTIRMREAALRMIRASRDAGCRVAVNGPDASDQPRLYLEAGADVVIQGETERTLPELIDRWTAGGDSPDLRWIPGLVLAGSSGAVHRTPPRAFVEDLDALPFPAWDLVDVARYREAWTRAHGRLSWNIVTTRGCPFHCNWCAKPLYGTRYAQRSAANVAEEMRRLKDEVSPGHVWFADDIFGLTPRWIESFAEEVSRRDARIPFMMQSRVDLMTPSAVAALAEAGAEEVWMGVESGSQKILDAMDKGIRVEQTRRATRLLRQHGIRPAWFLQLGYPGEEWADLVATRELVRSERPDDIGVSVSYPLPGTKFYESVKEQLGGRTNWADSDDLAMMFEGTYAGGFYKKVRDLLHAEALLLAQSLRNEVAESLVPARAGIDAAWKALELDEASYRSSTPFVDAASLWRRAAGAGS
jgi:anaerobic magnesium-protoporphyrin IX monomethyl ester cyclase